MKNQLKKQNWYYILGTVKLTHLLWAELCPIKIHMLKPQPPVLWNVTVFADRAFKEAFRARLNPILLVPLLEEEFWTHRKTLD